MARARQQILPLIRDQLPTAGAPTSSAARAGRSDALCVGTAGVDTAGVDTAGLARGGRPANAGFVALRNGVERVALVRREPVRWGSAVVQAAPRAVAWQQVGQRSSRGRRTTVWVAETEPERNQQDAMAGSAFARNRTQHALDLFGACMLIVALIATAVFV